MVTTIREWVGGDFLLVRSVEVSEDNKGEKELGSDLQYCKIQILDEIARLQVWPHFYDKNVWGV